MSKRKSIFLDSDSDDSDDANQGLTVNKVYAREYKERKQGEELSKLKDQYVHFYKTEMAAADDESESSHELEDDVGILADDYEGSFLSLLPRITARDPTLKNNTESFFQEIDYSSEEDIEEYKPVHYKDMVREDILGTKKRRLDDDGDDSMPLAQQREAAKAEFMAAAFNDSEDSDDDLLTLKKTQKEIDRDIERQKQILEKDDVSKKYWLDNNDKSDSDRFLLDYIVNKRWLSPDEEEDYEIDELLEMEDVVVNEKAARFEAKHNFRHEEPGGAEIAQHSREPKFSVRKSAKKEARKQKRENRKKNKEEAKRQIDKDIMRLKKLQKKTILERLKNIQSIAGVTDDALQGIDLDQDFDADAYDEQMQDLFNDDFYTGEEIEKPQFEYNEYVDDDYVYEEKEMQGSVIEKVIEKHRKNFGQNLDDFDKYLDEYYQLDYEDIVGGKPVRFKYTKVPAYDYGLGADEILTKTDKELNRVVGLKQLNPYREDGGKPKKKNYYNKKR